MNIINRIFAFLFFQADLSYQWNPPSFISQWIFIDTPVSNDIIEPHGLNEVPVKVDVQIKISKNDKDYIFTGVGTAQRDDDDDVDFGGLVYVYNSQNVILYPPAIGKGTVRTPGLAYTGSSSTYKGPSSVLGWYKSGYARIRAWRASDFPAPTFSLSIDISDFSGNCFQQQTHGSSVLPDFVTAQVDLGDGYISEGQGNIFQNHALDGKNILAGVVFGYDSEKVRMWVPSGDGQTNAFNGAVFARGDGFGISSHSIDSATVTLKGYQLDKAFQTSFIAGRGLTSDDVISFGNIYSIDSALVMVQVKEQSSGLNNPNMIFNGVGSSMIKNEVYSGVVYVYTNDSALLYTPSDGSSDGYMVYLGDRWGNGQYPSAETTAEVIVTVFSDPVVVNCPDANISSTSFTMTNGLQQDSVVQYSCNCGFTHTSGNLIRTCTNNGTWDGTAPVCSPIQGSSCPDPFVSATWYNLSEGLAHGSLVQYSCITGYIHTSGNLTRTCTSSGSWDGIDPVCSLSCRDPGEIYNASYHVNGLLPGDTANYTCLSGSQQQAGDSFRTCQASGEWDGIPIVCVAVPSQTIISTSPTVKYSPEELAQSIEQTKKELSIERKETSSYKRKLTSAKDTRPSATYIGTGGIVILCSLVIALTLSDIVTILSKLHTPQIVS